MQEENIYQGKAMHGRTRQNSMGHYGPDTAPKAFQIKITWIRKGRNEGETKGSFILRPQLLYNSNDQRSQRHIIMFKIFLSCKMLREAII